jgi:hypothetical protein
MIQKTKPAGSSKAAKVTRPLIQRGEREVEGSTIGWAKTELASKGSVRTPGSFSLAVMGVLGTLGREVKGSSFKEELNEDVIGFGACGMASADGADCGGFVECLGRGKADEVSSACSTSLAEEYRWLES